MRAPLAFVNKGAIALDPVEDAFVNKLLNSSPDSVSADSQLVCKLPLSRNNLSGCINAFLDLAKKEVLDLPGTASSD